MIAADANPISRRGLSSRSAATPAPLGDELLQRLRAPIGPRQLSSDARLENQMLQALSTAPEWTTEVAFFDAAIGHEKCVVVIEVFFDMATHVDVSQDSGRSQSHQ
jgi:hypothetical protein